MNARTLTIAAASLAVTAMPVLAQAGSSNKGYESCVKAFVASLAGKYETAPKLKESHYIDRGGFGAPSEMTMIAHNAAAGHEEVARATCTVNTEGEVVSLRDEPIGAL